MMSGLETGSPQMELERAGFYSDRDVYIAWRGYRITHLATDQAQSLLRW